MSAALIAFGAALALTLTILGIATGIHLARQRRNGCVYCQHAHYRCADCWQPLADWLPCPDHICPHELEQLTAVKAEHICTTTEEGDNT